MRRALGLLAALICFSCTSCSHTCDAIYEPNEATGTFHLTVAATALAGATVTVCRDSACTTVTMKAQSAGASVEQSPLTCSAAPSAGGSDLSVSYVISDTPADGEIFTVAVRQQNVATDLIHTTKSVKYTRQGSSDCGYDYRGSLD